MAAGAKSRPISGRKIDPAPIVTRVCATYGDAAFVQTTSLRLGREGMVRAVREHDNTGIYEYLMDCFNYQGVSNSAASGYLEKHGSISSEAVRLSLTSGAVSCPKLSGFDAFEGCGFVKSRQRCNNTGVFAQCPLPKHDLRKGALNQAAYSLYLFLRDRADGDLVGFMDGLLERADRPGHPDRQALMRRALIGQLIQIFGVSRKVLNMTFADLLIGSDPNRSRWVDTGSAMIAIDTLVHNFLSRTGIHYRSGTEHQYGSSCYGERGCEGIIDTIAREIDARRFNPDFPTYFPRFVQHAIWRFCAEGGAGICNGRNIGETERCDQQGCAVFPICGRVALSP
jgi:hypothetical protein